MLRPIPNWNPVWHPSPRRSTMYTSILRRISSYCRAAGLLDALGAGSILTRTTIVRSTVQPSSSRARRHRPWLSHIWGKCSRCRYLTHGTHSRRLRAIVSIWLAGWPTSGQMDGEVIYAPENTVRCTCFVEDRAMSWALPVSRCTTRIAGPQRELCSHATARDKDQAALVV